MRSFFQSLLAIIVAFVYVAGPVLNYEMEHTHEVSHGHGHDHAGDDHDHSHHPCDEKPVSSSESQDERDSDGGNHTHTHIVTMGGDTPFAPVSHQNAFLSILIGTHHPVAISECVPDGPFFPLIKPPQLG